MRVSGGMGIYKEVSGRKGMKRDTYVMVSWNYRCCPYSASDACQYFTRIKCCRRCSIHSTHRVMTNKKRWSTVQNCPSSGKRISGSACVYYASQALRPSTMHGLSSCHHHKNVYPTDNFFEFRRYPYDFKSKAKR